MLPEALRLRPRGPPTTSRCVSGQDCHRMAVHLSLVVAARVIPRCHDDAFDQSRRRDDLGRTNRNAGRPSQSAAGRRHRSRGGRREGRSQGEREREGRGRERERVPKGQLILIYMSNTFVYTPMVGDTSDT